MGYKVVYRANTVVTTETASVQCNVCGLERFVSAEDMGAYAYDMHKIALEGGWGDSYPGDMAQLTFVTCGTCLRKWVSTFAVPTEPDCYGESLPPQSAIHSETGETWLVNSYLAYPKGSEDMVSDCASWPEDTSTPLGAVWEHFKGQKYQVLALVRNGLDPKESLVLYRALYGNSQVFVRPHSMWNDMVPHRTIEGEYVRRFTLLS